MPETTDNGDIGACDVVPFFFQQRQFSVIIDKNGDPWWIGKEVCDELGYVKTSHAINRHCKCSKLLKRNETFPLDVPIRGLLIINEPDLFRLIMGSNMPEVEPFKDWIFEEVLPTIRKTGKYETPANRSSDIMEVLKNPRKAAELLLHYMHETIRKDESIQKLRPQAKALARLANTPDTMTITESAKTTKVKPRRYRDFLQEIGWIYSKGTASDYLPYQKVIDAGYMVKDLILIPQKNGDDFTISQARLTKKGVAKVAFLIEQKRQGSNQLPLFDD